jgi:hypothetical protein
MRLSQSSLVQLLNSNAVELVFNRRRPLPGDYRRRMLATNDTNLLNSTPGRVALNFHGAPGRLKFSPEQKGLVMTWDIFIQDFRLVPVESVDVVSVIPTTPPDQFWNYFNKVLAKMPENQKVQFMHTS